MIRKFTHSHAFASLRKRKKTKQTHIKKQKLFKDLQCYCCPILMLGLAMGSRKGSSSVAFLPIWEKTIIKVRKAKIPIMVKMAIRFQPAWGSFLRGFALDLYKQKNIIIAHRGEQTEWISHSSISMSPDYFRLKINELYEEKSLPRNLKQSWWGNNHSSQRV